MQTKRNYSLELLRVMAMFGVVFLHVCGGIAPICNGYDDILVRFLLAIFYCSVDIFAILSGYLKFNKANKTSSILNIILSTLFWSLTITFILVLFNKEIIGGTKELIKYAFPFWGGRLWYISCYVFAFFCFPVINKMVEIYEQREFKRLLIISFFFLGLVCTFGIKDYFNCVNNGYSSLWLLFCYGIGCYLGKYLELSKIPKRIVLVLLLFTNSVFLTISSFGVDCLFDAINITVSNEARYLLFRYNSPFTLFNALLIILYIIKYVEVRGKVFQNILKWMSSVSLGVYIIHAHPFFLDKVIIHENLEWMLNGGIIILLIKIIICVLLIYLFAGVLEYIRQMMFKILKINNIISYIGAQIDDLLN